MPCEHCVLELKSRGEIGVEAFLEQFFQCRDCPRLSSHTNPADLQTLAHACKESARLVRKLKSDGLKQKRDLDEARKEQRAINEKFLKLDRTYEQASKELSAHIEQISKQKEALKTLSTPILHVWDKVLALPVMGAMDGERAARMMETLLSELANTRTELALVDLTGIDEIDRSSVEHFFKLARAAKLLGATVVLTGIRSGLARTFMELGVDLSGISVASTVEEALRIRMHHIFRTRG